MSFELAPLPYPKDALEPYMSSRTLDFHHDKHHRAYVTTLSDLTRDTPFARQSLEEIIHVTANDDAKTAIFNNAAQAWNHDFFWNCMRPSGGGRPVGALMRQIEKAFGDFDGFKEQFKEAATAQFGSGWAWLILDDGRLGVSKTPDAVNPLSQGQRALLACDVWEHAYYLDFQNRRPDFVQTFLDHLVNWDFVSQNIDKMH